MKRVASTLRSIAASHCMSQLDIWPIPQGSPPESIPISIDLVFSSEEVRTPNSTYKIYLTRAKLRLLVENANVVRGSRLGDYVLTPSMVEEVSLALKDALTSETGATIGVEAEIQRGLFGKIFARVIKSRNRSKKREFDSIVKAQVRADRIVSRPNDTWDIVEPLPPHILDGHYIGVANNIEVGPLCLITLTRNYTTVSVAVIGSKSDIIVRRIPGAVQGDLCRNKELAVSALIQRSIPSHHTGLPGRSLQLSESEVLLNFGILEVSIEH